MHKIRNPRVENVRAEIQNQARSASTLTEVLVALMITSIGLVSVATLFPLSILRSIRATQLTAATESQFNAVSTLDRYPNLIGSPINYQNSVAYLTANGGNLGFADPPGPTQNYVIDPLGFAAVSNLSLVIGGPPNDYHYRPEHYFGNDPSNGTPQAWAINPPGAPWVDTSGPGLWGIARYPAAWRTLAQAHYLVTLPDSWLLQYDTVGGVLGTDNNAPGSQVTQITLSGLAYPTTNPPAAPYPSLRVVMFSADGLTSQTRNVTGVIPAATGTGSTIIWTEDTDGAGPNASTTNGTDLRDTNFNANRNLDHYPLPLSFVNSNIGIVRLEAQDPRYTWLLTMRQPIPQTTPASASVDVVVFFNRSMENIGTDELLYTASFSIGSNQVTVTYPTGNNTVTNKPLKPFMKKGGFVFDANNAYWYRISNVVDNPLVPGTSILTLEVPANASNTTNPNVQPRAMFPPNIVDVYPLGSKP